MSKNTLTRIVGDRKYILLVATVPFGDVRGERDANYRQAYDLYNRLNEFWFTKVNLALERDSLCGASFYECWTGGEYRVSIQMRSPENYERLKASFATQQEAWMAELDVMKKLAWEQFDDYDGHFEFYAELDCDEKEAEHIVEQYDYWLEQNFGFYQCELEETDDSSTAERAIRVTLEGKYRAQEFAYHFCDGKGSA
jgi:hypothetical protein